MRPDSRQGLLDGLTAIVTGAAQGRGFDVATLFAAEGARIVVADPKAGLVGLTKAAAEEVAHVGVGVNAVQPGLIKTATTAAMPEDVMTARVQALPMQRAGEPEEVARVVPFLASDLASSMAGVVLEVAGGRGI